MSDQRGLVVSVESPREDIEYTVGEIVPVNITVADSNGFAITNATVEVTSHYDMQYVHVPLSEVTRENQSEVAVYAPDPNISPQQGEISEAALVQLNNQGFLRLPSSEGEWSVTLQVRPLSPQGLLLPYERQIEIHVRAQPSTSLYLVAAGWICVIAVGIFLVRRRIQSSGETRRKRARHRNVPGIMTAGLAVAKSLFR